MSGEVYDVIVIGGGPAGSTSAMRLARCGLRVLLLEKGTHPRFHIGESFLPSNLPLIDELGLRSRLEALPRTRKLGAEFAFGDGDSPATKFRFNMLLGNGASEAINIERAPFDAMLLEAARDAGAQIEQNLGVRRIGRLEDGDVRVESDQGEHRAKWLIDASGQATVVGRHLRTRTVLPHLKKVAYFGHFSGVDRLPGDEEGHPTIVMCDEGWFWIIPLDAVRTSIGLVMHHHLTSQMDCAADQALGWGIARCPLVLKRTRHAEFPDRNHVMADFSYRCSPYAGPGHFLVGDAATFMDPIFSTGVCLAMMGAVQAADSIEAIVKYNRAAPSLRRQYIRYVEQSSSVFFRMVGGFYKHHFRELFMEGQGPLSIHRAVIGVLAGHVFPRPVWPLRWRLRLFEMLIVLQRWVPLAPRRASFSLFATTPVNPPPSAVVTELKCQSAKPLAVQHAADS